MKRIDVFSKAEIDITPDSFHSLIVLEGEGEVSLNNKKTLLKKGDSVFIPAGNEKIEADGNFSAILSYI